MVAKLSKRTLEFSHVVAYSRAKVAFAGTADSLLDVSFYGTRWVLLSLDTSSAARPPARRGGAAGRGVGGPTLTLVAPVSQVGGGCAGFR